MSTPGKKDDAGSAPGLFPPTHWTVVLHAGDGKIAPEAVSALNELCRTYWYPIYACIRRAGRSPHDAEDLTQSFFASLLKRKSFGQVRREKGRFRSFLLAALGHFLCDDWDKQAAQKRGAGQRPISLDQQTAEQRYNTELVDHLTPETIYERRWALTLLAEALRQLEIEYASAGKIEMFNELSPLIARSKNTPVAENSAPRLHMTPEALRVTLHRMRRRFGELFRSEVAKTVASRADIEDEVRHLAEVVSLTTSSTFTGILRVDPSSDEPQ